MLKRIAVAFGAMLMLTASGGHALSQTKYPDRTVKMIVPFPPGGGADILARMIGQKMNERWGQAIVVENKSGNAGILGSNEVGRSSPDGYTLLLAASGAVVAANIDSLAPIALVTTPPYMLAVHASMPVKSVPEFVDYLKKNPSTVNFASSGVGSASHLAAELFMRISKTEMTHVPYRGIGQGVNDLIGNRVSVMFGPPQALLPQVAAGHVRVLAVTSKERYPLFPDIPTIAESGVPGFEALGWYGILAAAGTPDEIVKQIADATNDAIQDPTIKERMITLGAAPRPGTPEDFRAFLKEDTAKWTELLSKVEAAK
jgi:tripartite-type tricarboxylate transporter receptor subunit TctC